MGYESFVNIKTSEIFRQEVKPMVKFEDENEGDTDFDNEEDFEESGDGDW